jgi:hypothetical protein
MEGRVWDNKPIWSAYIDNIVFNFITIQSHSATRANADAFYWAIFSSLSLSLHDTHLSYRFLLVITGHVILKMSSFWIIYSEKFWVKFVAYFLSLQFE